MNLSNLRNRNLDQCYRYFTAFRETCFFLFLICLFKRYLSSFQNRTDHKRRTCPSRKGRLVTLSMTRICPSVYKEYSFTSFAGKWHRLYDAVRTHGEIEPLMSEVNKLTMDMERLNCDKMDLETRLQQTIEENEALRKGMHEILESVHKQDGMSLYYVLCFLHAHTHTHALAW